MSTPSPLNRDLSDELPSEMLDRIDESLIAAPSPQARADLVCNLIHELYQSIAWFGHSDVDDEELQSLQPVVQAAEAYRNRSREPGPDNQPSLWSVAS